MNFPGNGAPHSRRHCAALAAADVETPIRGTHMKISVVTACYNSQATIAYTIESFLGQTHADKELLIIDGASKDDTVEIAQSYGSAEIRIVSEPDRGVFDAMNKGLRLFEGEAVGFLNSDDTFHDNRALALVAEGLSEADIAYGDLYMVTDHQTKSIVRVWRAGQFRRYAYQLGWQPPHQTLYMRRKVVERTGSFDLSYISTSDYDYMLRAIALNDFRVCYLPHVLADFQMGGISTRNWAATLRGTLETLRSRQVHLGAPMIDAAIFLRLVRRIFQLRRLTPYLRTENVFRPSGNSSGGQKRDKTTI